MLDVSGSMDGNLPLLRAASQQLFGRLGPDDVARVGSFGHEITISPDFTQDRKARGALPEAIAPDAPTPLWRALDAALDAFGEARDAPVVLVLSDGKDSGPSVFNQPFGSQAQVIDRARNENVMVYAIGMRSRGPRQMPPGVGPGGLQAMLMADLPDPGLARSRNRRAAATRRSALDRISARHSPALPTSCTVSISSASHRRSATARSTISTCA